MAVPYWVADTSRHPLVTVHLVGGDGRTQPDFDSLIRVGESILAKRERVVIVHDLRDSLPDAHRRQRMAQWIKDNIEQGKRYVVAYAVVAPTAFHRGVLVATLWFVKPATPVEVFGTRPPAEAWAVVHGQLAGLHGLS